MPYIFSTATNNCTYVEYDYHNRKGNLPQIKRRVLVKGGANRADKRLITPNGVVTEVSDDDLAFLVSNAAFIRHQKAGFHRIESHRFETDAVVTDMVSGDKARPLTPEEYRDGSDRIAPRELGAPKADGASLR